MVESDLQDAFNDCIDRLAQGSSVDDCLSVYPQHARQLRPMLETGLTVKRAQPVGGELNYAQSRVESRLIRALEAPVRQRRSPIRRLLPLVAAFALILLIGGTTLAAQDSLPGDTLYGLKRLSESAVSLVSSGDLSPEDRFAQRRVDETRRLLALNRAEEVTFRGIVELTNGTTWLVAGLPLTVAAGTPGINMVQSADRVEVLAFTTPLGELIAIQITLLEDNSEDLPTPTPISTTAPTLTSFPTNTRAVPTATPSVTSQPSATLPAAPTECVPLQPLGWISYSIQTGDTLSGLAGGTGAALEQVLLVNCIEDASRIIAGQTIFLPTQPQTDSGSSGGDDNQNNTEVENTNENGNNDGGSNSGPGGGSSGNDNANDDDDGGNDNSGGDDDDN